MARILALLVALPIFLPIGALALDLAPHRAIYTMDTLSVRSGGEVSDVSGQMFLEWADGCDGWTLNQQVRMNFVPRDGEAIRNDFSFSSWEARDGSGFRYTMRTKTNGQLVEQILGRASLNEPGGAGLARFRSPENLEIELPPGTIFPTQHLYAVIEHALGGGRTFNTPVFSGTGTDSLNDTTAFIGEEIAPGTLPIDGASEDIVTALAERASWTVDMGYYPYGKPEAEPEFEVHYRIVDNGVASNMDLDYGDFALRAVLDHLEYLPVPSC